MFCCFGLCRVARFLGVVRGKRALPAELYPQMWESAFINFLKEGCVTALLGLPGELRPEKRQNFGLNKGNVPFNLWT